MIQESLEDASKNWGFQHDPSKYRVAVTAFERGAEWAIRKALDLMDTCLILDENYPIALLRERFEECIKQ